MSMKILKPKDVKNKNKKLEIDTTGDIVEKMNQEYENVYGNVPTKKKMDFLDICTMIFLLIVVGILILNFLGIL